MIIVSLTSFPAAIGYAVGAIKSVLQGSVLPDKLVLYVTLEQFGHEGLPPEILRLARENDIFEIRDYPRDIRSYRKLIPALIDFPDATVVTIDDDVCYHPDMLRKLLKMHAKFPDDVIAHRAKRIRPGKPYKKWEKYRWYNSWLPLRRNSFTTLQTGAGGVLYPPHALSPDMINEDLFTTLAPTADDIWFWAAATANGRRVLPVPLGFNKPRGLGKPREISLKKINVKSGVDRNRIVFDDIIARFPKIRERIENE